VADCYEIKCPLDVEKDHTTETDTTPQQNRLQFSGGPSIAYAKSIEIAGRPTANSNPGVSPASAGVAHPRRSVAQAGYSDGAEGAGPAGPPGGRSPKAIVLGV
jgi:hypothetical protein